MSRYRLISTSIFSAVLIILASSQHATAAEDDPVNKHFSSLLSTALGAQFDANALDQGVPASLVALIKQKYPSANNHNNLLKEYQGCARTFDGLWKEYTAQLQKISEAVKAARKLKSEKKQAEAMAALEAVITNIDIPKKDHLGRSKPAKRTFLEVRDADISGLIEYATLVVEQRKLSLLPYIHASFNARRKVSTNEAEERISYLAAQCGKHSRAAQRRFHGFASGQKPEVGKATGTVLGYVQNVGKSGNRLAKGFFASIDKLGVQFAELAAKSKAKKGTWVVMKLKPTKATKKKISYKKKDRWKESYDCVQSNDINGIDPVTGKWTYALKCKTRSKSETITLKASLAKPTDIQKNSWGKFKQIWLMGKVKKAGPHWSLSKAEVIELPEKEHLKFLDPSWRM